MLEAWHYVALLGAAIAAMAFIKPMNKKKEDAAPVEEMKEMMEHYIYEAEQDYAELVGLVKKSQESAQNSATVYEKKVMGLEEQVELLKQQLQKQQLIYQNNLQSGQAAVDEPDKNINPAASTDIQVPLVTIPAQIEEASATSEWSIEGRYKELFELYNNGRTIESIAKKLAMNKGEVQLIIQLAKQEAKQRG